jgi:hypothetical protein
VISTPPSSPIRRQYSEEELIDLSSQYVSSSSTCDCHHHKPHASYDLSIKSEKSLKIHVNSDNEEDASFEENSFEEWNDLYSEKCCVFIPNGATEEQILDELERAEEEHNKKRKHSELRRVIFNEISVIFH